MTDKEKRELIEKLRSARKEATLSSLNNNCPSCGQNSNVCTQAADALEATLWRQIEEAPKDGTKVQLNVEPLSYSEWTARWCVEASGWVDQDGFVFVVRPTHFKPLDTPETE